MDAKAIECDLGIRVINMRMRSKIGSDVNYFDYLLPNIRGGDLVIYSSQSWLGRLSQEAEANEACVSRRLADRLWEFAQIDLPERHHVNWPLLLPISDTTVFNRLSARAQFYPVSSVWQSDDHGGLVQCPTRSV